MKSLARLVLGALLLVFAGLAIAWFTGVFDKKIYPGPPQEPPVAHSSYFDDVQSTFAVPVKTTIAAAEQYAKSKIPDPISFKQENFHIGPIFVISLDGGAHITNFHVKKADSPADSVKVDADFNGHGTFSPQIIVLKPHFGFDFNGHLTLTASAAIDAKWSVAPKYELAVSISKIDLNHVGDVTGLFRGMFEDQIKRNANDVIGKAIVDGSAEVKRVAAQAWNSLRVSHEMTKTPPVWFNIEPTELSMSPLSVTADQLGIRLGVAAKTRAYIDEKPPALAAKDMPGLVINPNLPNRYNIVVPIEVSLDQLTTPLNQALEGKDFEREGVRVHVSSAKTTGSGDSILLSFDFKASRGQFLPGPRDAVRARPCALRPDEADAQSTGPGLHVGNFRPPGDCELDSEAQHPEDGFRAGEATSRAHPGFCEDRCGEEDRLDRDSQGNQKLEAHHRQTDHLGGRARCEWSPLRARPRRGRDCACIVNGDLQARAAITQPHRPAFGRKDAPLPANSRGCRLYVSPSCFGPRKPKHSARDWCASVDAIGQIRHHNRLECILASKLKPCLNRPINIQTWHR